MKKPKQKIVVCPVCRSYYSYKNHRKNSVCEQCKNEVFDVDISHDVYMSFSDEEKTAFKEKYLEEHFANYVPPFHPEPQNGWSGFIGCCGSLSLGLLLIFGFMIFVTGNFGVGIAMMVSAFVSGGVLILLSNIADDVHYIRNQVDKLHHDQKYRKP